MKCGVEIVDTKCKNQLDEIRGLGFRLGQV